MLLRSIFIAGVAASICSLDIVTLRVSARTMANEPGSTSLTRVTNFVFLQNLGNPCGVSYTFHESGKSRSSTVLEQTRSSPLKFYQSMLTAILIAIQKLYELQNADPNLADCNGLYLKSLPPSSPYEEDLNVNDLFRQVYQSGIFLAAHLHIMSIDRQMALKDDEVIEDPSMPVMTLRCGNESEIFLTLVQDLTKKIEDILCTLIGESTKDQRVSYRLPYNALLNTQIYRYHTSCSLLQTRDCLLVKETKSVLQNMLVKFNQLLSIASDQSHLDSEYLDTENNLF